MTLRTRFTLWTTTVLAIVLAGTVVVLARLDRDATEAVLDTRVLHLARGPGGAADGRPEPPPPRPQEDGEPPEVPTRALPGELDGAHAEVFHVDVPLGDARPPAIRRRAATGTALLDAAVVAALAARSAGAGVTLDRTAAAGRRFAVATQPLPGPPARRGGPRPGFGPPGDHGAPRAVLVALLDTGPALKAHAARTVRTGLASLAALAVGALLSFLLAGRLLRPLRRAADAAEAIASPEARLPAPAADDELGRLVHVLNAMLARLDAAAGRERQFLASASHELRRPLASLLGELELASGPGRDADALRESVRLARADGLAMQRLVDDLLHHARARAGQLPLLARDVALADLVAEAVARSRRALHRPDAAADTTGVPDLLLRVDADALRQVVENLVTNAWTHAGPSARVAVTAARDAAGVTLAVEDDGPGIPADEQARVFEPFGRGDRARAAPGFGLGLAIAREVARAMGGALEVRSPVRADDPAHPGTRFTLRVPARGDAGAAPPGARPRE